MDNNPSSPLDTLRQLKEMLDAGALTPTEFEALKQRLVFTSPPATNAPAATTERPAVPPTPALTLPPVPAEQASPMFEDVAPAQPSPAKPAPIISPAEPLRPVAVGGPAAFADEPEPEPVWTGHEFPAREEVPARNPLALVLSIGGVLAFLAVVAYLTLNRPPSEHISSTSQTAADSLATTIDTGPQAEPLPQMAAAPETIRVAPAHPAPVIPARSTPAAADSVAPPVTSDSAVSQ